jgi:hypothetical protein
MWGQGGWWKWGEEKRRRGVLKEEERRWVSSSYLSTDGKESSEWGRKSGIELSVDHRIRATANRRRDDDLIHFTNSRNLETEAWRWGRMKRRRRGYHERSRDDGMVKEKDKIENLRIREIIKDLSHSAHEKSQDGEWGNKGERERERERERDREEKDQTHPAR